MTDIEKVVWGGLAGVTIFVIGQLLSKFLIEPLYELRKEVGNIRFYLAFHASTIHTPIGRNEERSEDARQALLAGSCCLLAKLHAVPGYMIVRHVGALPKGKDVEKAADLLRGLSTYVHEEGEEAFGNIGDVGNTVTKIENLLRLKPLG